MILELACIAVYYLACDSLNPNKNRKKETQTKFMEGDIMTEIEKKLKGINITAGGSVNININIQVNEYNECTFNNLKKHLIKALQKGNYYQLLKWKTNLKKSGLKRWMCL